MIGLSASTVLLAMVATGASLRSYHRLEMERARLLAEAELRQCEEEKSRLRASLDAALLELAQEKQKLRAELTCPYDPEILP